MRSGREARPGEVQTAWIQLQAAVDATGSTDLRKLLADLPEQPAAGDPGPITTEL